MMQYRFEYFKDGVSLGETFRNCETYDEALACAKVRINEKCDKIVVSFGENFDAYFEVK